MDSQNSLEESLLNENRQAEDDASILGVTEESSSSTRALCLSPYSFAAEVLKLPAPI
jgi:hypothetical protein